MAVYRLRPYGSILSFFRSLHALFLFPPLLPMQMDALRSDYESRLESVSSNTDHQKQEVAEET